MPDRAAVESLPAGVDVVDVRNGVARIQVTPVQLELLRNRGYDPRIIIPDYRAHLDTLFQNYHTYAEVCSIMQELAGLFPDLCRLDTIGMTVAGREILAMRVTDNPAVEEAEPEIRITGSHHGDEKISTEIALSFIRHLLTGYEADPTIRELVDSREIWVIPILNADGHVANSRRNANNVDINRDYGYKWDGRGGSARPFSQPETRAIRQHGLNNNVSLAFDFHSVASYVNYLWDNHPTDPPDSAHILALAERYVDSTHGSRTTELTPINGYEWYAVYGSCQDAGFGIRGNLDYTIETKQPASHAAIDSICEANRRALMGMLEAAGNGINGTVLDSLTRAPLPARISIADPLRWHVYADPGAGDFHKPLPPGTWTVTAFVPGYAPKTTNGVVVPEHGAVTVDFDLVPDTISDHSIEELVWLHHADPNHVIPTHSTDCLGPPDGRGYSLGRTGELCLSTGAEPVRNLPGDDITVHDSDTVPDGYWLYASRDWNGPWSCCGHANGTASFDLGLPGLDSAHYLRIICDSTGSGSNPQAGLDLDAVTYRTPSSEIADRHSTFGIRHSAYDVPQVWPVPTTGILNFRLAPGSVLKIIDTAGRLIECCRAGDGILSLNVEQAGMKPGVYLAIVQAPGSRTLSAYSRKLVVTGSRTH